MHAAFLLLLMVVTVCTVIDGFQTVPGDVYYYSFVTRVWTCVIGWAAMLASIL